MLCVSSLLRRKRKKSKFFIYNQCFSFFLHGYCLTFLLCFHHDQQNLSQSRVPGRRFLASETDALTNMESRNVRRPSSSTVAGGLPPLGRWLRTSKQIEMILVLSYIWIAITVFFPVWVANILGQVLFPSQQVITDNRLGVLNFPCICKFSFLWFYGYNQIGEWAHPFLTIGRMNSTGDMMMMYQKK